MSDDISRFIFLTLWIPLLIYCILKFSNIKPF